MSEQWKKIPGFPGYDVSNQGRVRSHWTFGKGNHISPDVRRVLKPAARYRGRLYVTVKDSLGIPTQVSVHRLVLFAFVGPCPEGMVSCHNDGDHLNNTPENLRWDTRKANWNDRRIHGVANIGEKHGRAKVTAEQVIEMRELYAQGYHPKYLAEKYGLARLTVNAIVSGKSWKSVKGPITRPGQGSKKHLIQV